MKLAEMLDTSTSYIGEIEICAKVPSMGMVEKIAEALGIEPFRLFVDDRDRIGGDAPAGGSCLEGLTAPERQELARRIIARISSEVEQILRPENSGGPL